MNDFDGTPFTGRGARLDELSCFSFVRLWSDASLTRPRRSDPAQKASGADFTKHNVRDIHIVSWREADGLARSSQLNNAASCHIAFGSLGEPGLRFRIRV
jgi:hypothetical protein